MLIKINISAADFARATAAACAIVGDVDAMSTADFARVETRYRGLIMDAIASLLSDAGVRVARVIAYQPIAGASSLIIDTYELTAVAV